MVGGKSRKGGGKTGGEIGVGLGREIVHDEIHRFRRQYNVWHGHSIISILFHIINIFQSVLSYALFQKDSACGAGSGLYEFHLGAAGKAHDVHVGPLQFVDVPEDFHNILFGVNAGAGISGTTASGAVIVGGDGDHLSPFHKSGSVNTCVMFLFQHVRSGIFTEELEDISLGSFEEFHGGTKMEG